MAWPRYKNVKTLRELTQVQCCNGNWNYSPYMHGMANGMIFAISILCGSNPKYLSAPKKWLDDRYNKRRKK